MNDQQLIQQSTQEVFADLALNMLYDFKQKLGSLISAVDQASRGGKPKPQYETMAKLFDADPTAAGKRKPGELEELYELFAQGVTDSHLVADEVADVVYYAYQLPSLWNEVIDTLQAVTGWNEITLVKIAIVKYAVRTRYGRKAFDGDKELAKQLEQAVMQNWCQVANIAITDTFQAQPLLDLQSKYQKES